ncbi:hypothetical protein AB0A77_28445 [Streptomyces varsoviensis]|uniref:hypothetical protein n=1 Tax=Streptomyces varsoviensis TaxID=67373 RepID=UPI0033D005FB
MIHHLQTIRDRWDDLHESLATPTHVSWPPAGLTTYLRDLEDADRTPEERQQLAAMAAAEHADRRGDAPGPRPVPLSVRIFDTMRTVERDLVDLADQVAADIQRPVIPAATGRGWTDDVHRTAVLLSARDSADRTRWHYTGTRTAPLAAAWLIARLTGAPGPFRPLTLAHRERIARIAEINAERVERALGLARREVQVDRPCPRCLGELVIDGGDGEPPAVQCVACGRTWSLTPPGAIG